MVVVGQQAPRQLLLVLPLRRHTQLATHEQQLLAGRGPLVAEQHPEVCQPLPPVARHPAEEGALAVDHLVVREREHVVLRRAIHRPEREIVGVVAAMHRVPSQVLEGVVHPPHVPLVPEAETPTVDRCGHPRPRRRLLGDHLDVGVAAIQRSVQLLEEAHRTEVLVAAVLVGDPLALGSGVVAVEHRCDRVDPETVDVVLVDPEVGARQQKAPNL